MEIVHFYPYSGWHTGKSINDGRGWNNLYNQIKPKDKNCSDLKSQLVCCCGHKEEDCSFKKNGKCQK